MVDPNMEVHVSHVSDVYVPYMAYGIAGWNVVS